jgi:hypothetical protein
VGDSGHDLAAATGHEFGKNRGSQLAPNVGESIAVEEKERGTPMTMPKEIYRFGQGEVGGLFICSLSCNRFVSLSIKAVLRASS